ncbi:hypothetical protein S7335_3410 [Synechococcus sp. PCC 7335]|uniref:NAD(P)H-dependent oxidoreductase n=1 Tax=Synechococcus sp. (strain ATCC 29403 / PCC 7335) TaxID=91464 RepID=UPI00017EE7DC|nr:NAD(P)H-dependent oxidoreductase [Synechococcus sp. PCC 7335]EDX85707.1 hypothetical protein S7335_3410 [Synechococcus sp. PCC 7335]
MTYPSVLFINCTLKQSPEVSNTDALWRCVAHFYCQQGCQIRSLRTADLQILSGTTLDEGTGDDFPQVLSQIQQADILILGTPLIWGNRTSECQRLIERLYGTLSAQVDAATGQPILYGKVFGLVAVGDQDSCGQGGAIAHTCQDFSRLGCIHPPHNWVTWFRPIDTEADFIEAEGKHAVSVNKAAKVLVENSIALLEMLRNEPLSTNLHAATQTAKKLSQAATVETGTFILPKTITTKDSPSQNEISYRHVTKRIWTVMQAGAQRGFKFKVVSLEDRTFLAERAGKGFIYKIYPGHFSFRIRYQDYDAEQLKSHKLSLLAQQGLAVPISYGTFKSAVDIPDDLPSPIVAKPESGSLSQNVFPNLKTPEQLQQAAATIEASGDVIKLESHISGRDYRVLVINHQYAGCVERRPANVVGDGRRTIRELFHLRNQEPGRGDRYETHTTIHKLVFDRTSRQRLESAGYSLETVLLEGEVFYLQEKITASTGSDYIDCSDQLHKSIAEDCVAFSHRFKTLTLGFDVITTDITRPLTEVGGAFNEYNFLPYVDLHENCNIGKKRSVCALIWDYVEANADRIVTERFDPF